ncbi:MAG: hypothetical protein IJJ47_10445 [Methanosphaera sp.]|nr:hypothetical protein [Methanosphaera sp.]
MGVIPLPLIFLIFIIVTVCITGLYYNQWSMCITNIIVLGLFGLASSMLLFV